MSVYSETYPYPGMKSYGQQTAQKIERPVHDKHYTAKEVDAIIQESIKQGLGKLLKISGNVTFDELPTPGEDNLGCIYNITEAFESDDRFLDGPRIKYPAGSNIVSINNNGEYKFDVLSGEYSASDEGIQDIIDDLYKD